MLPIERLIKRAQNSASFHDRVSGFYTAKSVLSPCFSFSNSNECIMSGDSSGCSLDESLTNIQWLCKLESNQILDGEKNKRKQPTTVQTEVQVVEEPRNPHPKPPYSYASLILFAINSSPEKKLTLQGIYSWIEQHFPFYKFAKKGWKNSIRHNLSLHRFFIKEKRPSSLTGKGSFWSISPDCKENVMREILKHTNSKSMPCSNQIPGQRYSAALRPLLPKPQPLRENSTNISPMVQNKMIGNNPIYVPAGTPIVFVPTPMYMPNPQTTKMPGERANASPLVFVGEDPQLASTPIQAERKFRSGHVPTSHPSREVQSHIAILRKSVSRKSKGGQSFHEADSGICISPKKPKMMNTNHNNMTSAKSGTKSDDLPTLAEINGCKDYPLFSPEKYKDFLNNLNFISSPNRTDLFTTPSKKDSKDNVQRSPNNFFSPLSEFKGLTPTKGDVDSGIFTPFKEQKDLHDFSFTGLTPYLSNTPLKLFESPVVTSSTKKKSKGCRKALINDDKMDSEIFLRPLFAESSDTHRQQTELCSELLPA